MKDHSYTGFQIQNYVSHTLVQDCIRSPEAAAVLYLCIVLVVLKLL